MCGNFNFLLASFLGLGVVDVCVVNGPLGHGVGEGLERRRVGVSLLLFVDGVHGLRRPLAEVELVVRLLDGVCAEMVVGLREVVAGVAPVAKALKEQQTRLPVEGVVHDEVVDLRRDLERLVPVRVPRDVLRGEGVVGVEYAREFLVELALGQIELEVGLRQRPLPSATSVRAYLRGVVLQQEIGSVPGHRLHHGLHVRLLWITLNGLG